MPAHVAAADEQRARHRCDARQAAQCVAGESDQGGQAVSCSYDSSSRNRRSVFAAAKRLLPHGIVVAPGAYLGESGEGFLRIALVPTEEECVRAAAILEAVL